MGNVDTDLVSACLYLVLIVPINSCWPLYFNPGAESGFLDRAEALPGKRLLSPKWELWLEQQTHASACELAGGSWWGAACCFFCFSFHFVWFGLVWSIPAWCDHISGVHSACWGNEQIYLTQQHLVLLMIFAHMQTLYFVLVAQRTVRTYSYADVHAHCFTLFTALLTALLLSSFSSLMFLRLHEATALHASDFISWAPWWNHPSYSALCLMQVWELLTQLRVVSPWTCRQWPNAHPTMLAPPSYCFLLMLHLCPLFLLFWGPVSSSAWLK